MKRWPFRAVEKRAGGSKSREEAEEGICRKKKGEKMGSSDALAS